MSRGNILPQDDTLVADDAPRYLALVQIYTLYERFWHWSQAALILLLLFTGFHLHGSLHYLTFHTAWRMHVVAAVALMLLWIFTIFWQFATGNWRHFVPLLEEVRRAPTLAEAVRGWLTMVWRIARYYAWGIMRGEHHPYKKRLRRKHNPLQAFAYFALMIFIGPVLWVSGIALLGWDFWRPALPLASAESARALAAFAHMLGAWLMLLFVVLHVYMATLGKTTLYLIKGMITGVEHIWLTEAELAYLRTFHPHRLLHVEEEPATGQPSEQLGRTT